MNKAEKIIQMIFVSHDNSSVILYPGKEPFNLPSAFVTTEFSAILRFRLFSITLMRRDQLDPALRQFFIERVGIISFIADQLFGHLLDQPMFDCCANKSDFMRRSIRRVNGERKTRAICHCHELRTLAPLGLSNPEAPFLAETNVPSIKHSERSNLPRLCKSSAKASRMRRKVPSLTQSWNLRWQVWYGGNRSGKSAHGAPVRNIHKMPLITSRLSRQGLPLPSVRRGISPSNGPIIFHCSSLNSSRRAMFQI
jgi:hypothetical protein